MDLTNARVDVLVLENFSDFPDFNVQFFLQLSAQSSRGAFACLDFSSREFPFKRKRGLLFPLTHENLALTKDQAGNDFDPLEARLFHQKNRPYPDLKRIQNPIELARPNKALATRAMSTMPANLFHKPAEFQWVDVFPSFPYPRFTAELYKGAPLLSGQK